VIQTSIPPRGIGYETWRSEIDGATDIDQLVKVMRRYMASWMPLELNLLPTDLAATVITGRDAIFARSVMASRAELVFTGSPEAHEALRQMSRTFGAAAARLSFLEAYNTIAP
jgi:hypothetical protein